MTENTQKTDRTLAEDDLATQPLTPNVAEQQAEKGFWVNLLAQGLWRNNPAIVQLLGLCPLLAVSNSATNALGLGLATLLVLICTNMAVSLFRKHIPHEIRIPIYVMIIATTVTVVQLLMNAYTYSLYQSLGIFIPLIVTNCIVIGRAEAFASKNSVLHSMFDGFAMGLGMTLSLFTLGAAAAAENRDPAPPTRQGVPRRQAAQQRSLGPHPQGTRPCRCGGTWRCPGTPTRPPGGRQWPCSPQSPCPPPGHL